MSLSIVQGMLWLCKGGRDVKFLGYAMVMVSNWEWFLVSIQFTKNTNPENPIPCEEEEEIGEVLTRVFYLASSLFCEPLFNFTILEERVKGFFPLFDYIISFKLVPPLTKLGFLVLFKPV
ncbi:unnamed protein product [Prunus armeniaca]